MYLLLFLKCLLSCHLASSYLLFNTNKSTFVSVCSLLFSNTVHNTYTPIWENSCRSFGSLTVSFLPSASFLQHPHLCQAVQSSYGARSLGTGPPSFRKPNLLWERGKTQTLPAAAASVCRQPTCCLQVPPWISALRTSIGRTSEGKPEDILSP